MQDLTPRQTEILKKIIIEYTESGEPVGSDILDKKYNLGVSPATVRNEMVELAKKKYLKKAHFSSGRIPTAEAFRFYISNLMQEKELSTADEVSYKSDIWDFREEVHQLLQQATRALAKRTKLLAATTTSSGDVFYYGTHNILDTREFWDIDLTRHLFEKLDERSFFEEILSDFEKLEQEILYMMGAHDMKNETLEDCGSVFAHFAGKHINGAIGVMGPKRMRYDVVIPNVRYFAHLIQTIIDEQGF